MKCSVRYSKDGSDQSDYKQGAITISTTDAETAFRLGEIFSKMCDDGREVVHSCGYGELFIRIPVHDRKRTI